MRVYKDKKLEHVYCNKCGRAIKTDNELILEGDFHIEYKWDYFSCKDGMIHSFDLCEKCYDNMVDTFLYPIEEKECTEYL